MKTDKTREFNDALYEKAMEIATKAHKGQVDKAGSDYIGHPLRVAERLKDEKEKIVAVLHDTIEDTFVTPEYLAEQGFPQEIIDGVLSVTRQDGENYDDFVRRETRRPRRQYGHPPPTLSPRRMGPRAAQQIPQGIRVPETKLICNL